MIKKLKTYKTFENHIIPGENLIGSSGSNRGKDINYEREIDKILESLVQQKVLISMLGDTINHVSSTIEKILPDDLENFMGALEHYEDKIYTCVDKIKENLLDGYPNLKDMIEEVEININEIEKYLKEKS